MTPKDLYIHSIDILSFPGSQIDIFHNLYVFTETVY